MNAVLPAGYRLQVYASVDSTNTRALAAARAGDAGGLWITAREQTVGRGRRARSWSSPPGNLYASLLLINPSRVGNAAGTISLVAAVALDQALIDLAGPASAPRLALKWPNDVLCDGRKIAGILVEGEELGRGRNAVVVGVGVNCRSHPEIEAAQPAGDLAALGFAVAPEVLFGRLAIRLDEELRLWDGGRNFDAVRERWLARSAGVGAAVRVMLPGGDVEGAFETVDGAGRMILRQPDGSRRALSSGDASVRFSRGAGR